MTCNDPVPKVPSRVGHPDVPPNLGCRLPGKVIRRQKKLHHACPLALCGQAGIHHHVAPAALCLLPTGQEEMFSGPEQMPGMNDQS